MERNIRRLLLTLLVFFVLSTPPPGAAKYITWVYIQGFVSEWDIASSECNENADGLVIIRNQQEAEAIVDLKGWIGLRKYSNKWKWANGREEAEFLLWDDGEPRNGKKCVWKERERVRWKTQKCGNLEVSLCMKYDGILVQEKKTWEEALVHCRELQGDLISLPTGIITRYRRDKIVFQLNREALRQDANTDEVWVGLRFLAGEWLWMSGDKAQGDSLPQCPAHHLHCGAIAHNDTKWKIMDCSEKRNFLCSMKNT